MTGWELTDALPADALAREPRLAALDRWCDQRDDATRYRGPGVACAWAVPVAALTELEGAADERALFVSTTVNEGTLRALLAALVAGEVPPAPPRWGAVLCPDLSEPAPCAFLEAYRGSGPVLEVPAAAWGAEGVGAELLPLSLSALDPRRASMTPGVKRGEGPGNLDRRADWFQGRAGDE